MKNTVVGKLSQVRVQVFLLGFLLCGMLVCTFPGKALAGDEVVIKLGTLAPEGSVWYKSLREADQKLRQMSEGRISLKVYPGGVSGNESAIIRKIRINQLQAGSITAVGLIDIDRSALAMQLPMVIESFEELRFVREKMETYLDEKIAAADFKVLGWGEIGWTYFFTKTAVTTPEELKQVKLFSWDGDPAATEAFRAVHLHPVTVASTDVLPALQTGMIEGFPTSALSALSLQWFGLAKNMVQLKWAPMIGATIISLKAWNKIPEEMQPKVLEIMDGVLKELNQQVLKLDTEAIDQMKKLGLNVVAPADLPAWSAFAAELRQAMRGGVIPEEAMDKVQELHKEYKAKESAGSK